jgi:hypothetical protein
MPSIAIGLLSVTQRVISESPFSVQRLPASIHQRQESMDVGILMSCHKDRDPTMAHKFWNIVSTK